MLLVACCLLLVACVEPAGGFEPSACRLRIGCSTTELRRRGRRGAPGREADRCRGILARRLTGLLTEATCRHYAGTMPSTIVELPIDLAPPRSALVESPLASIDLSLERAVVEFLSSLAAAVNAGENDLSARVEYRQQ